MAPTMTLDVAPTFDGVVSIVTSQDVAMDTVGITLCGGSAGLESLAIGTLDTITNCSSPGTYVPGQFTSYLSSESKRDYYTQFYANAAKMVQYKYDTGSITQMKKMYNKWTKMSMTYEWETGGAAYSGNYYTVGGGYATAVTTSNSYWTISDGSQAASREQILKQKIKAQLSPAILAKNKSLMGFNAHGPELKARELLLDMVTDREFMNYLRRGFIMVNGASGVRYKVAGGHEKVISYVKNSVTKKWEPFESFCIVFKDSSLPYTDCTIMRKILIETDEFGFRKMSNITKLRPDGTVDYVDYAGGTAGGHINIVNGGDNLIVNANYQQLNLGVDQQRVGVA